jgi:hypothetical protein
VNEQSAQLAQPIPAPRGSELRAVIEEFGRVLDILGAQLSASVQEAEQECAAVGKAFRELATAKSRIDEIDCDPPACEVLRENSAQIGASLDAAVVGLQYHDRLAQRVGHIRAGLNHLQQVLRDGSERSHADWLELLRDVEEAHRQEQLRLMAAEIASNGSAELF